MAIAAAQPRPAKSGYEYRTMLQTEIEPNKETMAQITAALDAHKAAGGTPQTFDLGFELKPEQMDFVVYIAPQQIRHSALNVGKVPMVTLGHYKEFARYPMVELNERFDMAVNGGPGEAQG
jgi:hypothetical protein